MTDHVPDPTLDRRPIAARDLGAAKRAAGWLVDRGVSPNAVSIAGLAAGLAAGAAFGATAVWSDGARILWIGGAALVLLRLCANMLDGMVAIGAGRASPVGELYNEVPDRFSDAATLIGLGYAAGGHPELGYAAALLAVLTAYVRAVGKGAGASSDFRGPMAKQQRMFLVVAVALYLAAVPTGWQPRWGAEAVYGLPSAALLVIALGSFWTVARRLRGVARELRGVAS